MNILRAARPLATRVSSFAPTTIPRFVRAESTAASTYENIIVSSPKPGVGLSMCSVAGKMAQTADRLQLPSIDLEPSMLFPALSSSNSIKHSQTMKKTRVLALS